MQAVTDVLYQCGNNIDAAIRKLGDLKLLEDAAAAQTSPAAADAPAAALNPPTHHDAAPDGPGVADGPPGQADSPPETAEHWVDGLVSQMSSASDVGDARQRAGAFLQAFEQFVMSRVGSNGEAGPSSKSKAEELGRENQILKRAVQIQNARLQDLMQKEAQLQQLQQLLKQYQDKVNVLERTNYSLSLHLQQYNNTSSLMSSRRPPDVF